MLLTLISIEHKRMFQAPKPIGILHLSSSFTFARVFHLSQRKILGDNEGTAGCGG
jgi:hypothetical protein